MNFRPQCPTYIHTYNIQVNFFHHTTSLPSHCTCQFNPLCGMVWVKCKTHPPMSLNQTKNQFGIEVNWIYFVATPICWCWVSFFLDFNFFARTSVSNFSICKSHWMLMRAILGLVSNLLYKWTKRSISAAISLLIYHVLWFHVAWKQISKDMRFFRICWGKNRDKYSGY